MFLLAGQHQTRIIGKINLSDEYVVYIQSFNPETGSKGEGEEIGLDAEGDFTWTPSLSGEQWIQVTFMLEARNRQLGATFPLFLRRNEQSFLSLHYDNSSYLEVLEDSNMSGDNQVFISYSAFINRSTRERFDTPKEGKELHQFLQSYTHKQEELIKKLKVQNKEVKKMEVGTYNAQLETALTVKPFPKDWIEKDMLKKLSHSYLLSYYNGIYNLRQHLDVFKKKMVILKVL